MGHAMVAGGNPAMKAPTTGILLGDIAEGSIVKLNENSSPVDFYVAKHDYESSLNGAGRTLLVRKETYGSGAFADSYNVYPGETQDVFLNTTYKALHEQWVQELMGETIFEYVQGENSGAILTTARSVFAPSSHEVRQYTGGGGEYIPVFATICAGISGTTWTRSSYYFSTGGAANFTYAYRFSYSNGSVGVGNSSASTTWQYLPMFTLPATALFDEETSVLKGVA